MTKSYYNECFVVEQLAEESDDKSLNAAGDVDSKTKNVKARKL